MFGVTEEAFIVFAANAFALLGLRALYFLVTGLLDRLVYLSTGLSLILAFIGVKLCFTTGTSRTMRSRRSQTSTSLLVIIGRPRDHVVASLLKARRDPDARAHAGSLRDHRDDRRGAEDLEQLLPRDVPAARDQRDAAGRAAGRQLQRGGQRRRARGLHEVARRLDHVRWAARMRSSLTSTKSSRWSRRMRWGSANGTPVARPSAVVRIGARTSRRSRQLR